MDAFVTAKMPLVGPEPIARGGARMARPMIAAKSEAASPAEENGASAGEAFTRSAMKRSCRPPVTLYGFTTKTAVGGH
jgi:hypothetical protein